MCETKTPLFSTFPPPTNHAHSPFPHLYSRGVRELGWLYGCMRPAASRVSAWRGGCVQAVRENAESAAVGMLAFPAGVPSE